MPSIVMAKQAMQDISGYSCIEEYLLTSLDSGFSPESNETEDTLDYLINNRNIQFFLEEEEN